MQKTHSKASRLPRTFLRIHRSNSGSPPDYVLLVATAIIVCVGLLMLSSATSVVAFERFHDSYAFVKQQLLHGVLPGIALLFVTARIPYRWYARYSWIFLIATYALLLIVFVPGIGTTFHASTSWVSIGSLSIQTSEIAKLTFILWLSSWLTSRQQSNKRNSQTTLYFTIITATIGLLLILQPDLGTAMLFGIVSLVLFIVGNGSLAYAFLLCVLAAVSSILFVASSPTHFRRLATFLKPTEDIGGAGYHISQSLIAVGSGFWFGLGIGQSRQKFNFVPELANDSIFAIIAEELGFIFSSLLIVLFAVLFMRGISIARRAPDTFGSLLSIGITVLISSQVLVNIGCIIGLLPLTGIPLPFISLGGTNLAVLLASLGILTNISKHCA